MALITCVDCGRKHSDAAPACPQCGRPTSATPIASTIRPADQAYGWRSSTIICPHCGARGMVGTRPTKVKRGVSGGKAVGAVLTGGLSLLAVGLSRKQTVTEAKCISCGVTWHIE